MSTQTSTRQLSPQQYRLYLSIIDEFEKFRSLSDDEKYDIIQRIVTTRYIDLLCDWAFKHVFGHNEENLLLLLNDILPEKIVHITYDPNEVDILKGDDKQVIMDVICHREDGTSFICEMQRSDSKQFKNRMFYYGASLAHRQLKKGQEYDSLRPVYVICFMNFRTQHETEQLIYRYRLREDASHEPYGDQISILLCELPRLVKEADKPRTPVESWFEILRNMRTFASRPQDFDQRFDPIFKACLQNNLAENEQTQYFRAMITDAKIKDIAETYYDKGREEGRQEVRAEIIQALIDAGFDKERLLIALKQADNKNNTPEP